jgi:hypothetical protein
MTAAPSVGGTSKLFLANAIQGRWTAQPFSVPCDPSSFCNHFQVAWKEARFRGQF